MLWDRSLRTAKMVAVLAILMRHGTCTMTEIEQHILRSSCDYLRMSNLYTVLQGLIRDGLVSCERRPRPKKGASRPVNFYSLTSKGEEEARLEIRAWLGILRGEPFPKAAE